jgi:Flp pilus assembly protein TadB
MSKNLKENLGAFMVKKMNEKPAKQTTPESAIFKSAEEKKQDKIAQKPKTEKEIKEAEELDEAKKTSKAKSANFDQSGMIKKMVLETLVKYGFMVLFIVILIVAVINLGPFIGNLLHGLIFKTVIGAIH